MYKRGKRKNFTSLRTTHLIDCCYLLLLCKTLLGGDRDYTDDQTSRREMREKISLDTTTSRNRTRARMITYEASGWFLFLPLTNSLSPLLLLFVSFPSSLPLSSVRFCCYHYFGCGCCCCLCSLYILYYRFFGMWCHTRWKSPHYTYNIVIEKGERERAHTHTHTYSQAMVPLIISRTQW